MKRFHCLLLSLTLLCLPLSACAEDYPSLWDSQDPALQEQFEAALNKEVGQDFWNLVKQQQVGIALVDITERNKPKVAQINGDVMLYAASLPKIAILLGAFVEIERGNMQMDEATKSSLTRMIRNSSNKEATAVLNRVGIENLAEILQSDRYRLYDPSHNGGLWVGKPYGKGKAWQRDPLHGISHGATAMQAARFYYLGATQRLVAPELFPDLVEIMSKPAINHKFVKGLKKANPEAEIYRKSGTWRQYHADSGVVVADDYEYIITALAVHPEGSEGMSWLIGLVDEVMKNYRSEMSDKN